ncbi:MAG: hypothetical protein ABIS86_04410 [Streptosporangiaceae bacterium]
MPRSSRLLRPQLREQEDTVAFDRPVEVAVQGPAIESDAAQYLENLRAALAVLRPHLYARLDRSGRRHRLVLGRPGVRDAFEHVSYRAGESPYTAGQYVWSDTAVGSVDDPAAAAQTVLRILTGEGRPT